jgi:hypothetical protein
LDIVWKNSAFLLISDEVEETPSFYKELSTSVSCAAKTTVAPKFIRLVAESVQIKILILSYLPPERVDGVLVLLVNFD